MCEESKAQISVEMIIVLAALIGIAIVIIRRLTNSASETSEILDKKTDVLTDEIENLDLN
jgi:flagellar biogenesis protein FliO